LRYVLIRASFVAIRIGVTSRIPETQFENPWGGLGKTAAETGQLKKWRVKA
jgi:hypothetical protein